VGSKTKTASQPPSRSKPSNGPTARTPEREPRWWLAIGLIIGPFLPTRTLVFDHAAIGPVPPDDLGRLVSERQWEVAIQGLGLGFSTLPPQTIVESPCAIVFHVQASDTAEVEERVRTELLPRVLSALDTLGPMPYQVELIAVTDEETRKEVSTFREGSFALVSVSELLSQHAEAFYERWAVLEQDEKLRQIADRLRSGAVLAGLHRLVPAAIAESAIVDYYLALEAIGRRHVAQVRRTEADRIRRLRERVVAQLRADLGAAADTDGIDLIAKARTELDRVNLQWVSLQVETAGSRLGLSEEIVRQAVKLCRDRNKLAHSGSRPDLARWLGGPDHLAHRVTAAFVAAELDLADPTR
jgi:hypothetical protein